MPLPACVRLLAQLKIFANHSTTDLLVLHDNSDEIQKLDVPVQDQKSFDMFDLIAPCLQQGMSITQRARELGVHRSTVSRAVARFKGGGSNNLVRKKRADRGQFELTADMAELIKAHLIALPHLSCRTIQRMLSRICSKQSWQEPTYWQIYRILKSLPPDLLTLSKDSAEYRRMYELIHRFEASCPNEIWQIDHNFMDIFVWDDSGQALKPILTVVLDDFSRAATGYYLDFVPPSAQRTALALRQAIWHKTEPNWLMCGLPEKLYSDRGADFVSKRLQKISAELQFEMIKGRPYHPQGKGKIERFFESMNQLFLCELPGYTPEDKPPQKPGLTLDELRRAFHKWLIDEYLQRKNDETGETPLARWQKKPQVPRMPESLNQLHMLLMTVPDGRLVRRDGIHTLNQRYINPDLQHGFMRESVVVRYDPTDISKVFVFHENKFICEAVCPELVDIKPSLHDVQKARTLRKKNLRSTISAAKSVVKSHAADAARPIPEPTSDIATPIPINRQHQKIRRYTVDA